MYPKRLFYIHTRDGIEVLYGTSCTSYQGTLDVMDHEPEAGAIMLASFAQGYWNKVVYGGVYEQQAEDD